jgi:hypothetical protein
MLQDLEGRDLIDIYHPDALFGKKSRISLPPKDLLRSLLEPGIQPGGVLVVDGMRSLNDSF